MMSKLTTRELVITALTGAATFATASVISGVLNAVTGTPLIGGLIVNLFVAALFTAGLFVVEKPGFVTAWILIHTALSIPTNNFGPPGAYKVFLGVAIGVIIDIVVYYASYQKRWVYGITGVGFGAVVPGLWLVLSWLGMPAADSLAGLVIPLTVVYVVEGVIGAWLGRQLYLRIKDKPYLAGTA